MGKIISIHRNKETESRDTHPADIFYQLRDLRKQKARERKPSPELQAETLVSILMRINRLTREMVKGNHESIDSVIHTYDLLKHNELPPETVRELTKDLPELAETARKIVEQKLRAHLLTNHN